MRRVWLLAAVIGTGLLSRVTKTGSIVIDKYLGDALFAVMIYLSLGRGTIALRAAWAMGIVSAIETFQLSGIPGRMAASPSLILHFAGRLLGTVFAWEDLVAYAAGISIAAGMEALYVHQSKGKHPGRLPGHRLD